jgi:hypothetical protein
MIESRLIFNRAHTTPRYQVIQEKTTLDEGHGFSRVPMSLRLTQGDENHGKRWFSTVP